MNSPTRNRFHVTDIATQAAGIAIAMAAQVPPPLKSIGDQLIRAATSVPANLSEGSGRVGRDRRHHWHLAYAEAKEVDVHLRILVASHAVNGTEAERAIDLFDQVRAITWRLLHP